MVESIKKNTDFKNVYNNGRSYANKYLVMYILDNNYKYNRLGISVSKKVGNSVVRHRLTRLIREGFRLNVNMFNSGLDIVVIARAGVKGKSYNQVTSSIMHLAKIHKILKEM